MKILQIDHGSGVSQIRQVNKFVWKLTEIPKETAIELYIGSNLIFYDCGFFLHSFLPVC